MSSLLSLGDRIRKRRIELDMSQTELAKLMGYADKSMIAKIEAGKVDLTQTKIKAAARALNTTFAYLLDGEQPEAESFVLSEHERQLIIAYRSAPAEVKAIIDKIVER